MARISVNGCVLHYEVDGDGPPLVVLHGGLGVDHTAYRRSLGPLAERFRLAYLDHRGNGRSEQVDLSTITMEQLADDVAGLADALDLGRFTVLGHSYGGFIAQELALRHPDRLNGLILVDTGPGQLGAHESPDADQGPPPPPELVAVISSVPSDDEGMRDAMGQLLPFYFPHLDLTTVIPLFDQTIHRVDVMMRGFEVLARWSSFERLDQIDVPTLVIVGSDDMFTSPPQSQRIARRIPNSELVIIDGSGHFPWIQAPEPFFAAVGEWVDRHLPT